jgi:hypothetical protein
MPKYTVSRAVMVWQEAEVEADDEEQAIEAAYAKGFEEVDSDTRDIEVFEA